MPFCKCGGQNPDDARFCSSGEPSGEPGRGPPRRRPRRPSPAPAGAPTTRPRPSTSGPGTRSRRPTASSTPSTPPRSTRSPVGPRPAGGPARAGLGEPLPARCGRRHRGPAPRQRDLPRRRDGCRVATQSSTARATRSRSATSATSTGPTSAATASAGSSSPAATRCRSAGTGWCSSPGQRRRVSAMTSPEPDLGVPVVLVVGSGLLPREPRMNIGEVLDRLRLDFPDHHPKDPVPQGQRGLIKPERTPAGYRKFSPDDVDGCTRRAADAARPPTARCGSSASTSTRSTGAWSHRPSIRGCRPVPKVALAAGLLSAGPSSAATTCDSRGASWSRSPRSPRSSSTSSSSTPDHARPGPATTTPMPVVARPPVSSPTSGSSRATCALQDRRRPRGGLVEQVVAPQKAGP